MVSFIHTSCCYSCLIIKGNFVKIEEVENLMKSLPHFGEDVLNSEGRFLLSEVAWVYCTMAQLTTVIFKAHLQIDARICIHLETLRVKNPHYILSIITLIKTSLEDGLGVVITDPYMQDTSMTTSIMSQQSSYDCMSTGELKEEEKGKTSV